MRHQFPEFSSAAVSRRFFREPFSFARTLRPQPSITASLEQRDFVIRELIETEANYLDVLQALKNKFMQPMEKLLKDEIKIIFPRIKVKPDTGAGFRCDGIQFSNLILLGTRRYSQELSRKAQRGDEAPLQNETQLDFH